MAVGTGTGSGCLATKEPQPTKVPTQRELMILVSMVRHWNRATPVGHDAYVGHAGRFKVMISLKHDPRDRDGRCVRVYDTDRRIRVAGLGGEQDFTRSTVMSDRAVTKEFHPQFDATFEAAAHSRPVTRATSMAELRELLRSKEP